MCVLKSLIHRNIRPTEPNKKINHVIYYDKYKSPAKSLIIIPLPRLEFCQKPQLPY